MQRVDDWSNSLFMQGIEREGTGKKDKNIIAFRELAVNGVEGFFAFRHECHADGPVGNRPAQGRDGFDNIWKVRKLARAVDPVCFVFQKAMPRLSLHTRIPKPRGVQGK